MLKKFVLRAGLEKWLYQNRAEVIDAAEGCLLDDLLVITKRGAAAILETYQNPNASIYTIYFSRDAAEAERVFYSIMDQRESA